MDEFWHRFEVSRALRPTMYPSHSAVLPVLTKDGHGSHEQMFDFARRAAAQSARRSTRSGPCWRWPTPSSS